MNASILDVQMICPCCGWVGTVKDCEPDCDGDGSLGCPVPDCGGVCHSMSGCTCMIAARINSTLACKALHELEKHDSLVVKKLIKETREHARRLHNECTCFPHHSRIYPWRDKIMLDKDK